VRHVPKADSGDDQRVDGVEGCEIKSGGSPVADVAPLDEGRAAATSSEGGVDDLPHG
jgi:hypothetical protein